MVSWFSSKHRNLNLLALSLAFWSLGEGLFIFFQPLYLQQLGADPVRIGIILSMAMAVVGFLHIPAGRLGDKISRKKLMFASWGMGTLACLMMGLASNLTIFVLGMLLYNVTGAIVAPMNSYLVDACDDIPDTRKFTLISAAYNTGYMISPVIGGFLGNLLGLQPIYLIATAIFVVSTVLLFSLQDIPQRTHVVKPGSSWSIFQNRQFVLACLLVFAIALTTYLQNPLTPNFLQNERGVDYQTLGIFGSLASLGGILFNLFLGKLLVLPIFLVGQAAVVISAALFLRGNTSLLFGIAYFLWGGYRVVNAITSSVVNPLLHKSQKGFGFGIAETAKSLAMTIAPFLAGLLYDCDPSLMYQVTIGLGIIMLISLILLRKKLAFLTTTIHVDEGIVLLPQDKKGA